MPARGLAAQIPHAGAQEEQPGPIWEEEDAHKVAVPGASQPQVLTNVLVWFVGKASAQEVETQRVNPGHHPHPLFLAGLWSLEYKQELTTPLCLAARGGHAACLRHLLRRRANPDLAPGGRAPLHEACLGGHLDCVELLLEHKADPNLLSDEGLAPLHLCTTQDSLRCAKLLLRHGATVDLPSEDGGETALHVVARHCLCDHARLYLRHGARVDARSAREETALGILCGQAPGAGEGCLKLSPSTPKYPFLPLPCNKIQSQHLEVTLKLDHCPGGAHTTHFRLKNLSPDVQQVWPACSRMISDGCLVPTALWLAWLQGGTAAEMQIKLFSTF
uniref:Ankyrin repeat and SOCS box containing 18 n=1 Tax=Falco tinnunculus TaxID=100819 RepID=A0A8C4U0G7_FALTI